MKQKILVIEDDMTIQETIVYNLQRNGYKVISANNGRKGLALARSEKPDLVVLDVMLPELDGIEVCRTLRKETNVPILMLTALSDEIDKVIGLEVGADDYLTKPFSMRELMARVKATLRRIRMIREDVSAENSLDSELKNNNLLISENLLVDLNRREVQLNNVPLRLKPKEYELLVFLIRNRGMALSRNLMLERVWGWADDNSRTIDVHVRWLREKIDLPNSSSRISTVRGVGYRFEG